MLNRRGPYAARQRPVYEYRLRSLEIDQPNPIWCADIPYIPMRRGFPYLVAIMDWTAPKVPSLP